MKKDSWLYGAAFVSGIVVWILVSSFSGKREAWDSELYWMLVNQGFGNLFPLGLLVLGLFAVPSIVTARLGAAISKRITRDRRFQ
jgi:hypothetical protein